MYLEQLNLVFFVKKVVYTTLLNKNTKNICF